MPADNLESCMIAHCAPTLAGLKSAGLFRYFFLSREVARQELQQVNEMLNDKGVYVEVMEWRAEWVLLYAYRKRHLERELAEPSAQKLLREYGYRTQTVEQAVEYLKQRVQNSICFPHEIGLFLGYPVEDVRGFIENKGQNCKCCGLWKVYCNEEETLELFCKLKKCSSIYQKVFASGRSLERMTIVA